MGAYDKAAEFRDKAFLAALVARDDDDDVLDIAIDMDPKALCAAAPKPPRASRRRRRNLSCKPNRTPKIVAAARRQRVEEGRSGRREVPEARLHVEEGEKALLPLARTYAQVVAACDGVCGQGLQRRGAARAARDGALRRSFAEIRGRGQVLGDGRRDLVGDGRRGGARAAFDLERPRLLAADVAPVALALAAGGR